MDFEIPEHIENRVHKYVDTHPGETLGNVLEKVLDQLEANEKHLSSEELVESFRKFRGMVKDWTFEEMLADRREGLR